MKQYAGTVCAISPSLQGIIVSKCDFMPDSLTSGVPQLKLYKVNSKLSLNIFVVDSPTQQSYVKHACAQQGHLFLHLQF